MVRPVYVAQVGSFIEFPNDASDAEITSYLKAKFPTEGALGEQAAAAPAPAGPDESSILGRFAYGAGTGFTDIPGGIASLFYPAEEAAKTAPGQFSEEARKYLQETFGIDPTKDPTAAQQAAQALGSVASFLVPGSAVAKGASLVGKTAATAGRLGTVTAGAQGVALGAEGRAETIRNQLASGMEISDEQQLASQRLSGLIGASEALPIGRFFGPLQQLLSKIPVSQAPALNKIVQSRLGRITRAGAAEGAQEVASGIANDIMEYGIYNPDVEIGQDILSNAGTGAFAGSFVEGVIQLAAGRKLRPYRQLEQDLARESAVNAQAQRQGEISRAAEELRQFNVEGDVEVVEDDFDGISRFTIRTPAGNTVGDFLDPVEAEEAIGIYKQRTDAKVVVRKPAELPSVFPAKINGKEYQTTDEIIADRDSLVAEAEGLASYMSRPDVIKREATRQNVSEAMIKKATDKKVAVMTKKITKLNEFVDAAKPPAVVDSEVAIPSSSAPISSGAGQPVIPEAVVPEGTVPEAIAPEAAAPEAITPEAVMPEAIAPEAPIGAAEAVSGERPITEAPAIVEAPEPVSLAQPEAPTIAEAPEPSVPLVEGVPEEPRTLAGPLKEAPAPRRTFAQAEAEGPILRDYNQATIDRYAGIYTALKSRLSGKVPKDVDVKLEELIGTDRNLLIRGQARVEKTPNGIKSVVDLSTGILRPDMTVEQAVKELAETLDHEIIHVLRDQGVIRPAEWKILSRAAVKTKVPGRSYTYLDKAQTIYTPGGRPISELYTDPDAVIEEAVAEMYKDWVKNKNAAELGKNADGQNSRGLFNRITEFFRSIFRVLKSNKYQEIFKGIDTGEVGAREGVGREATTRFSAGPIASTLTAGIQDPAGNVDIRPFPDANEGSSSVYLRRDFAKTKTRGRVRDKSWGEAFDKAFLQKLGRQFDINDPMDYEHIVASISDEIKHQMQQVQSGVGWYDSDIQDVFDELAKSFPVLKDPAEGPVYRQIFTLIAGVMSNGMKAKANVELAAINFAHFLRTGQFSPIHPFTNKGWNQRSNIMGPQIAMLNSMVADSQFEPRSGSNNPEFERYENFLRFMFNDHSVREINQFRARHGTKSPAKIGKLDDRRLGMYAFGPKFGPFILNLNGLSDETVDSWASRSFYRHMGRAIGADGELIQAPFGKDREAMKRALRDIAAVTSLSSRDIQAVLWFYEKELFNQLGQKIPLEVFSDGAREFTRRYGTGTSGSVESRTNREREISGAIEAAGTRYSPPVERAAGRFSAAPARRDGKGSYAGGKLAPLDGAPKGAGQLGPDPSLVAVAERYAAQNGINLKRQGEYVQVNEGLARSIADAYDKMPHAPQDPAVKEAYADLIRQTKAQYDALIDDGYVFTFFDSNSDPYGGNPWNAMRDLRANKRMAVYGTYDGYGTDGITGAAVDDNPMLADTGLKWPDQSGVLRPVTANDLFRAVHDAFGHGLEGAGFRARGEENAWQAHVRLFTGPAVGAITSETRGQNSWLNFGPYGEKNLKALLEDTVFAEQKTGLMPSWTWEEGRARDFDEGPRFSAAPLPPYIEAKNRTLFVPEKKQSIAQSIFDFFSAPETQAKTLNTVYGQIDMKGGYFGTRAAINRRMALVDQDAYVEWLEKTANEKEGHGFQRREANQSALVALGMARRRSQLTASSVMLGAPTIEFTRPGDIQSATVAVRDDADKLIDIFRVMLQPGPVDPATNEPRDKRTIFKSYATAMRAIGLKAAGKPVPRELDDTYINTTIQFTQQNYPEIVEAYKSYQRFNKKLLTAARDAGRITNAELAKFTQQMDYYGFNREIYEEQLLPGAPSRLAGDIKIREYKGSQDGKLIEDPMLVILSNVDFWMGAITHNIAVNKAFKLAKDMGEARLLGASEKPDLSRGESEQVMFFRENGVLKRFAVKDPMLVTSLGSDDRIDMGRAMGLMGMPTSAIRETITRDPAFMVANLLRDTLSTWITSGEDITPFIGTIKGAASALKGSASFQALMGRGVVGSHDLAMRSPAEMAAIIRRRAMPKNILNIGGPGGAQNMVMSLWDRLGVLSEASDAATRIAVYEAAIKNGMSEAEAAFRAIEIMNFSRRGSSGLLKILTQLIPFLNARIQGMDVLYQAGKAGILTAGGYRLGERDANLGKKFLVRGAMLAGISLALEFMLEDDEDYKELPDYVKNSNLLIPLKWLGVEGGYFAAIPKPFEAGLLFSTIPQEFYKALNGQTSTREGAKFFFEELVSTFGLNPIPQVMLPALEVIVNHDFYTGLPLISEGKMRLTPELQYDSRTSTLARMLGDIPIMYNFTTGKFEGVSPIVIDQLVSGYGGPMGSYIMQAVGMLMEGGDIGPERLPRDITQLPMIKRFLLDAESRSPKSVAQAYELFRVVDEVNRSFSRLRQTGDTEAIMDYLAENKDVLSYKKYIYKLFDGLNKISARERQIERDETMTRDEKFEAMNKLREVRARLTSQISEINKKLGR